MKKKALVGIGILLITVLAVLLKLLPNQIGDYLFDIFIVVMMLVSSIEMYNLKVKTNKNPYKILTFCYPIFYYILALIILRFNLPLYLCFLVEFIGLGAYLVITLIVCVVAKEKNVIKTGFDTLETCVYPSFLIGLFVFINHSSLLAGVPYFSFIFAILIFIVAMMTDTFAMLIGVAIKGKKLAPSISPNKTYSGAIGGLLGGTLGAISLYGICCAVPSLISVLNFYNFKVYTFALIGLIGSIIGQAGDLYESYLKRRAGVKDAGNFFPGHGGMLDRVDALTFVVAFMFVCLTIILV